MKNKIAILLLLLGTSLFAQNKMLTTENCVFASRDGISPQKLAQLNWIKGTDTYYYIDKTGDNETLMTGDAGGKAAQKKIIDLATLNDLLRHLNVNDGTEQKTFPVISWINTNSFSFSSGNSSFTFTVGSNKLEAKIKPAILEHAEVIDTAAATGNLAFMIQNNLWVYTPGKTENEAAEQVTADKDINIVNGHSVHREEFGITKGTFWSPSGNLLAFYRMDQTMVTDYPIMDLSKQPAEAKMIKYPMAGATSHQVTVGIYNVLTQKTIFLKTGEPKDQYLTNIAWSPDNKSVYISVLNREQNHLWLNRYNAATGEFEKTLFEEKNPKYVHPMHPLEFVPRHDDEFIWQSEVSDLEGCNYLFLRNTEGALLKMLNLPTKNKVLVPDLFTVTALNGMDAGGTKVFFTVAPLDQVDREVWSADLKTGREQKLTPEKGTHVAVFSADGKYFIDTYSSVQTPCIQSIRDSEGKLIRILLTAKNPLADYRQCKIRLFTITAADNTTPLWCRMILPADFDSTKKYRTLTYVYNGPNVQLVTNAWLGGADPFLYYMAQQGFIVFTVDGRGSGNRGLKFEQATFQHLGTQELADQEKGAQYLKNLSYVDANRMAVYGWSFGGFMSTSLMTRKAGLFKCGVAGGPVIDWSYYEVMYTERYMDTPQTNPGGYKEANLLNYAGQLQGKLLQIHGTSDDVVVWQHSLLFQKACIEQGKQCDYYVYPGHLHNVKGKDRVNLLDKVSEYIIANT